MESSFSTGKSVQWYRLEGTWASELHKAWLELTITNDISVGGWFNVVGDREQTRVDGFLKSGELLLTLDINQRASDDFTVFGLVGRFDGESFSGDFTLDGEAVEPFQLMTVDKELDPTIASAR